MRSTVSALLGLTGVCVVAPISLAHADLSPAAQEVQATLRQFLIPVFYAKDEKRRQPHEFREDVKACYAAVERGIKLGIEEDETMMGMRSEQYLFKNAKQKCAEYETWRHTVLASAAISEVAGAFNAYASLEDGFMNGENAKASAKKGADCLKTVDAELAAGADPTTVSAYGGEELSLKAARDKFCQGMVDWGAKYSVSTQKKIDGDKAAVAAKFTKVGIAGDRLRIAIANNTGIWGARCKLLEDPKLIAKAPVLYEVHNTPEGRTGVRRYQFAGNKLKGELYREFDRVENSYSFCK